MPERLSLRTVGGLCAVVALAMFILGVVIVSATGGPGSVIPETGRGLVAWVDDVRGDVTGFEIGTGLVVFGGVLGSVALIGFYDALRDAGPAIVLAPVLGIFGWVFVTISHALPIAMAEELVPDFPGADGTLQTTGDLVTAIALAMNLIGDFLLWGVAVPLFAIAVLQTRALGRWLGWLGLFVGVVGGWVGLLGVAVSAAEDVSTLGFLGFFVWMIGMGVALLRARVPRAREAPEEARLTTA